MKKVFLFGILVFAGLAGHAQLNPVSWSFTAKKTGDKTYEIHMKATIQDRWHLFSQSQPEDAVVMPTSFTFTPNPLYSTEGKTKEVGSMQVAKDATLGISAHQYANTVVFVQKVKVKGKVKTSFSGTVEYQTCDDKKCLPPKTVRYSVALD
jgi:thiol:disulfide interchange protein DsbD